jgi:hypothetical protein
LLKEVGIREQARLKRGAAGVLFIFQILSQSLIQIKVLPAGLLKVDSQITSEDRTQTFSKRYSIAG